MLGSLQIIFTKVETFISPFFFGIIPLPLGEILLKFFPNEKRSVSVGFDSVLKVHSILPLEP